jgi:hypothetical protein
MSMRSITRSVNLIFAVVICMFHLNCFADDAKADRNLVRTLMQKSGLSEQIKHIPGVIRDGVIEANQESGSDLSDTEMAELLTKVAEAFNATVLLDTVERHMQENLSEAEIRTILKWIDSPLGRKISRMEAGASTPEAYMEIRRLSEKPLEKSERVTLLLKLDDAVKATEVGLSISINLQVAFILAVTSELPEDQRPSFDRIMAEVNHDRPRMRQAMERETIAGFLYTYRHLTDGEIREYIAFAESEAGKKYHAVTSQGLNMALMQAGLALGNKMVHSLDRVGNGSI